MYAAVADLKSFVRGLPLVILILFMQFRRQAYRCVRSDIHILNTILFESVAGFTYIMTGCPAQNHLRKEVVLEMRKSSESAKSEWLMSLPVIVLQSHNGLQVG